LGNAAGQANPAQSGRPACASRPKRTPYSAGSPMMIDFGARRLDDAAFFDEALLEPPLREVEAFFDAPFLDDEEDDDPPFREAVDAFFEEEEAFFDEEADAFLAGAFFDEPLLFFEE
jgi:hypothetical protein